MRRPWIVVIVGLAGIALALIVAFAVGSVNSVNRVLDDGTLDPET